MAEIAIEGMSFRAYHGCMAEEKVMGNSYLVDLFMNSDTSQSEHSDKLEDTIDYVKAYELVKYEMEIPSKLLEHVGRRILDSICKNFPSVDYAEVKVAKLNPPITGQAVNVSVSLTTDDE